MLVLRKNIAETDKIAKYNAAPKIVWEETRFETVGDIGKLFSVLIERPHYGFYSPETHSIHIPKYIMDLAFFKIYFYKNPGLESENEIEIKRNKLSEKFHNNQISKDEFLAEKRELVHRNFQNMIIKNMRELVDRKFKEDTKSLLELPKLIPFTLVHEKSHAKVQKLICNLSMFSFKQIIEIGVVDEICARICEFLKLWHKFQEGDRILLPGYSGFWLHKYLTYLENAKPAGFSSEEIDKIVHYALNDMQDVLMDYCLDFNDFARRNFVANFKADQKTLKTLISKMFLFKIHDQEWPFYELMSEGEKDRLNKIVSSMQRVITCPLGYRIRELFFLLNPVNWVRRIREIFSF